MASVPHKIAYVVSSLARCGPNNQLMGIIKNLRPGEFSPVILTCGPESADTMWPDFQELTKGGIRACSYGRLRWSISGKWWLAREIRAIAPALVHSQNLRPDVAMSHCRVQTPWISTLRNYPFEDYVMLFGGILGRSLAKKHMRATSKCMRPIACGKTIAELYARHGIRADVVLNGVDTERFRITTPQRNPIKLIFTGALIRRKRIDLAVRLFEQLRSRGLADSMEIIGSGPAQDELRSMSDGVHLRGSVPDVLPYLNESAIFISMSESEGIPNSVLEALACGLPCILSDIPQHREIQRTAGGFVYLVKAGEDIGFDVVGGLIEWVRAMKVSDPHDIRALAVEQFNMRNTSEAYQAIYREVIAGAPLASAARA
jgi:glycosyltransferase involved in cell wall biosynthesis